MKKILVFLLVAVISLAIFVSCKAPEEGSGETEAQGGSGEEMTDSLTQNETPTGEISGNNGGNAGNNGNGEMDELGNGQTSGEDDEKIETADGETIGETEMETFEYTETETETETESTHILLPDAEIVDSSNTEEVSHEDVEEDWGLGGIPLG